MQADCNQLKSASIKEKNTVIQSQLQNPQIQQFFEQVNNFIQKKKELNQIYLFLIKSTQQRRTTTYSERFRMNKNFRSSKNLKQVQVISNLEAKDDPAQLKLKIKALQEQIELLKKTNLNIYIPVNEKEKVFTEKQNKDEIIKKLRVQLLMQQQESQGLRTTIKRLQKEKQVIKFNFQNQIKELKVQMQEEALKIKQLQQQNEQLEEQYESQKQKRTSIQKQLIEIKVQVRFLKEDLQMYKSRYEEATKSLIDIKSLIMQVQFNSKIYKADKMKITAIESSQLTQMRNCIFELQKQIQELLWKLANPKKQEKEKIVLDFHTSNVGEQIVRLKKNIDMQLGVKGDDSVLRAFLDKYSETNKKFKELIDGCKAPQKLINAIDEESI